VTEASATNLDDAGTERAAASVALEEHRLRGQQAAGCDVAERAAVDVGVGRVRASR
jgi:hypothetical protein